MPNYLNQIAKIFTKERQPAQTGHVVALTGAVMIRTEDGHNIVMTPALTRSLAPFLEGIAAEAEKGLPNAT